MCRWSVSSAFTAVQCNIKVYSFIRGSSSHRPCLCSAAIDFLLSCCFSMWAGSSCISQIRAYPTSVSPAFFLVHNGYLQGVAQWKKNMCSLQKLWSVERREFQPTCNHTAWGETPTQAPVPICLSLTLWLVNWDELHNNAGCNADKNMKHLNVITRRSFELGALQWDFHFKTKAYWDFSSERELRLGCNSPVSGRSWWDSKKRNF